MTLLQSWFWPDVSTRKNTLAAINETFSATIFLAGLTAVFAFIDFARDWQADGRLWGFASAAFFTGIAFGIRQKSGTAAVGLALHIARRAWNWIASGKHHPVYIGRSGLLARRPCNICVSSFRANRSRYTEYRGQLPLLRPIAAAGETGV
jgi:hypothetical protein